MPTISAPVGKSGPWHPLHGGVQQFLGGGLRVAPAHQMTAAATSRRLCGGMLVAIPTAIPDEPLTSRFGIRAGSTVGSVVLLS